MKRVIWKYEVKPYFTLELPADAQVLTVAIQHKSPVMWVLLDAEAPKVKRQFVSMATGEWFSQEPLNYIGTFLVNNDTFVSHLFELRREQ